MPMATPADPAEKLRTKHDVAAGSYVSFRSGRSARDRPSSTVWSANVSRIPNNVARKEVPMSPSSRNRQTFSKMTRERMVKERRAAKQEKKDEKKAAAAEALAEAVDPPRSTPAVDDEVSSGPAPDADADGAGDRPG
jgi:hypothetical protein